MDLIEDAIRKLLVHPGNIAAVRAIGIGCPGQCKEGVIVAASNFTYRNVPITKLVTEKFGPPCILLNDADAAMAAEIWNPQLYVDDVGLIDKNFNAVMITVGTGIGVSLMLRGEIYEGSNGVIEAGHMILNKQGRKCGCGQTGCAEAYASANNTAIRMQEAIGTSLKENQYTDIDETGNEFGAEMVFRKAASGNPTAVKVLDETTEYLAILCINICRVIDPAVIIFGGGMAMAGDILISKVNKHIQKLTWNVLPTDVELRVAQSADHGGIKGAAFAAERMHRRLQQNLQHSTTSQIFHLFRDFLGGIYNQWLHFMNGPFYIRAGITLFGICTSFVLGRASKRGS